MRTNFKWFTLVELIIVITILAILSTIWFVAFQSYTKNTRDSVRLWNIRNIESWLNLYFVKTNKYPDVESSTIIYAWSWNIIWYQWYLWDEVSKLININKTPLDPLDKEKYIYSTNQSKSKYQLMTFLETDNQISYINKIYAIDYTNRKPATIWNGIWILLDTNKNPITWTWIDILATNNNYVVYFKDNNIITWTWKALSTLVYTYKWLKYDPSLVWYWDMETTLSWWSLSDLSWNWNNWTASWWIAIWWVNWNWKTWKATYFNWTTNYIDLWTFDPSSSNMTISFWLFKNWFTWITEGIIWKRDWWSSDLSDHRWAFYIRNANKVLSYWRNWFEVNTNTPTKLWSWNNYTFSYTYWTWNIAKWYENWVLIWSWPWFPFWNKTNAWISIGRAWSQNWEYLSWILDEIRIYNRALSESEVLELYNSTK